jgi:hypothetical protein
MKKLVMPKIWGAGWLVLIMALGMVLTAAAAVKPPPATTPCCDNIDNTGQDSFE